MCTHDWVSSDLAGCSVKCGGGVLQQTWGVKSVAPDVPTARAFCAQTLPAPPGGSAYQQALCNAAACPAQTRSSLPFISWWSYPKGEPKDYSRESLEGALKRKTFVQELADSTNAALTKRRVAGGRLLVDALPSGFHGRVLTTSDSNATSCNTSSTLVSASDFSLGDPETNAEGNFTLPWVLSLNLTCNASLSVINTTLEVIASAMVEACSSGNLSSTCAAASTLQVR